MRIAVWLARLLLGGTFLVSGMAKMIDPWGAFFKWQDYFAAWGLTDTFPDALLLIGACALALAEFLTGLIVATGSLRRAAPICASAIMAFMLPLSLYIWVANPVDDCGCFGDFLIISNAATFWKNVVLSGLCVFLLKYNRRARCLFSPWVQWMEIAVGALYCVFVGVIGYHRQPLIDFRPYPVGTSLLADSEADMTYIYRSPEGKTEEFDPYSLPDEGDGWEFIETRRNSVDNAAFAILRDGEEVTDSVLEAHERMALLVIPDLSKATVAASYTINELSALMPVVAVTGSSSSQIERWIDLSMADYPVYRSDERLLKTLARGYMSIVFLSEGTVTGKISLKNLNPTPARLQAAAEASGSTRFWRITLLVLALEAAICLLGYLPALFRMRKKLLLLVLLLPQAAMARFTAADALLSAPEQLVANVGRTERLDLLDYHKAGLTDRTVSNRLGGKARILSMDDKRIDLQGGEAQTLSIVLLPVKNDTLIGIITTLQTPAPDSQLRIYNRRWEEQPKAWEEPTCKAWGKSDATFLLTEYTLSGDTLTLHDRTDQWDKENTPAIRELRYIWNPRKSKFILVK